MTQFRSALESSFLDFAQGWIGKTPFILIVVGLIALVVSLAADMLGVGGLPGLGARQFTLGLSGVSLLLAGFILVAPAALCVWGEWLLVGTATLAAAFNADFIVLNTGLPENAEKAVLTLSVLFSIGSIQAIPALLERMVAAEKGRIWSAVDWRSVGKSLVIAIEVGVLALLIGEYTLENEVFSHNILLLTFFGFITNLFLPARYRLSFFMLLSFASVLGVFGLVNGVWLIAFGLLLVGVSHLPFSFSIRIALLVVLGIGMAFLRATTIELPWSAAIWTILGSMFMFRLILYMYHLKRQTEPATVASALSYFFMMPNVVFPLFPVVDYGAWRSTHYNDDHHKIYQTGVDWVFRGAFQLILYRYVGHYLTIAPEDVTNVADLLRYLFANMLLYLRVSGQFHIIAGMLRLFGFNLPETHHLYFLSSSFTDYWRRINIYWKDFMLKVAYFPVYFRLNKLGKKPRLIVSTIIVFSLTWLLHSYQWFWLRGSFPIILQDILFWGILAGLVIFNILREAQQTAKVRAGAPPRTFMSVFFKTLRVLVTFMALSILWSLWNSASVPEWFALWSLPRLEIGSFASLAPSLLMLVVIVAGSFWESYGSDLPSRLSPFWRNLAQPAVTTGALILLVYLFGNPLVYKNFGKEVQSVARILRVSQLADQDADLLEQGYYESLNGVNRFNSQLWQLYTKRPTHNPDIWETAAGNLTDDFLKGTLLPNKSIIFYDQKLSTNQWGMRDKEYTLAKPPGTYRIALLGASTPMGWGVADGESFESLLEDHLNRESAGQNYEILNFGVSGYTVLQNLYVFDNKVLGFEPDALFYIAHPNENRRLIDHLVERVSKGVVIPYPELTEILQEAEVNAQTMRSQAVRHLLPYGDEIVIWAYQRMVQESRARNMLPVWIQIPRIVGISEPEESAKMVTLAKQAGFIVVDLSDVYDEQQIEDIRLVAWDWHPNATGHVLIEKRLYQALQARKADIPLGLP